MVMWTGSGDRTMDARSCLAGLSGAQRRTVTSAARRLGHEFSGVGLAEVVRVASQSCRDLHEYPQESLDGLVERVARQRLVDHVVAQARGNGAANAPMRTEAPPPPPE